MASIILGSLFIFCGFVVGLLSLYAAGMADRKVTWWEGTGQPLLIMALPTAIGIALIVFH